MTGFADLPPELIRMLWTFILSPSSIHNIALVTRNINELGADSIVEDRRRERKYSRITHSGLHTIGYLARVLEEVLLNPPIALYVRSLYIDDYVTDWDGQEGPEPPSKERLEHFKKAVMASPLVPRHEVGEWMQEIRSRSEAPILALLLMLLPNLETLTLTREGNDDSPPGASLANTIRRIALSDNTTILSRLTNVELGHKGNIDDSPSPDWILLATLRTANTSLPHVPTDSSHNRPCHTSIL